ncbi:glycosyltransferase family 39 protein [Candidatus Roizmanbacteria bacterium]|nr:glycosyltransferase family 39 protein [Candidatus Roizmanbacteria bacterium]
MLLFILIITIPAFLSLLNNNYFTMHDDQHIVRLFLLDKGIGQGYLYPRWVDGLGFNFGYPLYNFYPPLPYYAGWIFHLLGFSLIWSIKLTFILGFILAAFGIYLFVKKFLGKLPAVLASVLYTYFFYHAVLVYVRGALAEFFAMAVIPYVFLTIVNIAEKPNIRNSIFFGISFAALILTHPLVAVPSVFFIGFFFLFYLWRLSKERIRFVKYFSVGILTGLLLSLFFWLPSISERKFTMVDPILTRELASYKLHYIYPTQFLYSPWGYGGSIPGPFDGMTFQLGKVHIGKPE